MKLDIVLESVRIYLEHRIGTIPRGLHIHRTEGALVSTFFDDDGLVSVCVYATVPYLAPFRLVQDSILLHTAQERRREGLGRAVYSLMCEEAGRFIQPSRQILSTDATAMIEHEAVKSVQSCPPYAQLDDVRCSDLGTHSENLLCDCAALA